MLHDRMAIVEQHAACIHGWKWKLTYRLRLLPHDQNTGGFYVCVLQKADNATTTSSTHTSTPTAGSAGTKRALSPSAEERDASAAKKERPSTPAEDASSTSTPAAVSAPAVPNAGTDKDDKKKKQDWSYREDPFSYAPESDPELQSIVKYFKLKESFPRDTILVRNEEGRVVRVAYFTNELVKVSRSMISRVREGNGRNEVHRES